MPIRLRLTLVFALGMAVVLAGFGAFVYLSVGRDILTSVDLGLRARVQAMAAQVTERGPEAVVSGGRLIDPDESFAQVLTRKGGCFEQAPPVLRSLSSHSMRFAPSGGPASS